MRTDTNIAQYPSDDRRQCERVTTALAGKIFIPTEDVTLDCQVVNLSAGGAGLQCKVPPPRNIPVVLYIDGFGRFEGVTKRSVRGELGLRFVCSVAKRQRLLQDIAAFIDGGVARATQLRRHVRAASTSFCYFVPSSGESVSCQVLNISLQGVSLRTKGRPSIGEIVNLGCIRGQVMRYHDDGFAIQFLGVE